MTVAGGDLLSNTRGGAAVGDAAAAAAAAGACSAASCSFTPLPPPPQVLPEVRAAELAVLLRRPAEEAEAPLLAASPPLVYRAVKLNIRLGRWVRAKDIAASAKAHVDTVFAYRARHLALTGAAETLPAMLAAAATAPGS